jgi:hypothetical protein
MNHVSHGVNAFRVGEVELLLTVISSGEAVHLARVADPQDTGRGAVHDFYFDPSNRRSAVLERNYDQAALLEPRWALETLCGRVWAVMIPGESGPWNELSDEVAFSPTCKRCLAVMDKLFPAPLPDERLPLVAQLVAESILDHGHAEVRDVPGDQQQPLRTAVRTLVRQRAGQNCRSYVHESMIFFVSEAIYAEHAEENQRAAAEAIDRALSGKDTTPVREPAWRLSWDTWNIT